MRESRRLPARFRRRARHSFSRTDCFPAEGGAARASGRLDSAAGGVRAGGAARREAERRRSTAEVCVYELCGISGCIQMGDLVLERAGGFWNGGGGSGGAASRAEGGVCRGDAVGWGDVPTAAAGGGEFRSDCEGDAAA